MSERPQGDGHLVRLSERFTDTAAFGALFREGMDLVEATAGYLDGDGRNDAKALDRVASLTYATESMRLTTRLMQMASWLLLHRAVKEGEMTLAQANGDASKVKLTATGPNAETIDMLPERLRDLISRSMDLQGRLRRLDGAIHAPAADQRAAIGNPLVPQINALRAAFER